MTLGTPTGLSRRIMTCLSASGKDSHSCSPSLETCRAAARLASNAALQRRKCGSYGSSFAPGEIGGLSGSLHTDNGFTSPTIFRLPTV
jgi:hypothetical protein